MQKKNKLFIQLISILCAASILISLIPNNLVHASGIYNPTNPHSHYGDCYLPEFYEDWTSEWWEAVKIYLPLGTNPVNGNGYRLNYRLWHDKGIVAYGSPDLIWGNEWKNATQTGSSGSEVVTQNAGYYSNYGYGEWRYHGFTAGGARYTNINFPNDQGTVGMTKKTWISEPWKTPWNLETYLSKFNENVIKFGDINTRTWMSLVIKGWGEGTAYSTNPELYFNVLSAPTPWQGGQLRGWHNTTGSARYQTFDILPHYKKIAPPVYASVMVLNDPSELVLKDDSNNSGDNQTFRVRIKVDAELWDYDYFNDEVNKVNYFTRYDIDRSIGNDGWNIELVGWNLENYSTYSNGTGQEMILYRDMTGRDIKSLSKVGIEWLLSVSGRVKVNFHAPSNVNPLPALQQQGNFSDYVKFKGTMTAFKGGINAALSASSDKGSIETGAKENIAVNLDASQSLSSIDGKKSIIDSYRFWVSTNEADIFNTIGTASGSPLSSLPLSNIEPNTTIYCGVRVYDKELQDRGLEFLSTATTAIFIGETGKPSSPPKPLPPPPRFINMDVRIPEIAFDIIPFVASDYTNPGDIASRSVFIDGVQVSAVEFFSGGYDWGVDRVGFHRVDCEYISIDDKPAYSTDWVYVYSTKPNASFKLDGSMKINRRNSLTDSSKNSNTPLVVNTYPIVKRTWTVEKLGSDLFIDNTTQTDAYKDFLCKKPGQYSVTLVVENSLGRASDPYKSTFTIMDDYAPATICNLYASVLARNEIVKAYAYETVSTDGDIIKSSVIDLWYDANNDGTCEVKIGSWDGKNAFPEYTTTKLGKYKYVVTSTEEFGEPTIAAYVTSADSKVSVREKEFFVDNYAPMTDIYSTAPIERPNIDLYIILDKNLDSGKTQWIKDNTMSLSNNLIRMNIIPQVRIWDMKTYTYSVPAETTYNSGESYPPASTYYSSGGYSGYLNRYTVNDNGYNTDLGGYVSNTESKTATEYATNNNYTDWIKDSGNWSITNVYNGQLPSTQSYSDGQGYSGTLYKGTGSLTYTNGKPSGGSDGDTYTEYYDYSVDYTGTVTRTVQVWIPNIVWISNYTGYYSGMIYNNVRQPYTAPWRTNSKKYVLYISDSNIAELSDLQAVMSKTDASLIVAGSSSASGQIASSNFILNNKPLSYVIEDAMNIIGENAPEGNKILVQAGIDTFALNTANYDTENDPITLQEQLYVQNPNYFDNPIGTDLNTVSTFSNSLGWTGEFKTKLNTVGEYKIYRRIKDKPSSDPKFSTYDYYSGTPYVTIYAHRKPIAQAVLSYKYNNNTSLYDLKWIDNSFDYDHNISRADKGIVERKVMYRKAGGEWYYSWPTNLSAGTYEFILYVKDLEGAWSEPCNVSINLAADNSAPWINISPMNIGWQNADANVLITAGDSASGIDEVLYKWSPSLDANAGYYITNSYIAASNVTIPTIQSQEGIWYLHAKASDRMANSSCLMGGPYRIDKTAPVINADKNGPITEQNFMTITLTIGDNLSGVKNTKYQMTNSSSKPSGGWSTTTSTTIQVTENREGTWYLNVESEDNAGNISYKMFGSYTVTYFTLAASLAPNPALAGDEIIFNIETTGHVDKLVIIVDSDIVSKDDRNKYVYPFAFAVDGLINIKTNVFSYILCVGTDQTINKEDVRLRSPYTFVVRAYKGSQYKDVYLNLDVQRSVLELIIPGIKTN